MSNQHDRSHKPNPFDSRRTKRVSVITPRNAAPTEDARWLTQTEKVDGGESAESSADGPVAGAGGPIEAQLDPRRLAGPADSLGTASGVDGSGDD
jgi:hypothetical protein